MADIKPYLSACSGLLLEQFVEQADNVYNLLKKPSASNALVPVQSVQAVEKINKCDTH
jgi:hypothetical protein